MGLSIPEKLSSSMQQLRTRTAVEKTSVYRGQFADVRERTFWGARFWLQNSLPQEVRFLVDPAPLKAKCRTLFFALTLLSEIFQGHCTSLKQESQRFLHRKNCLIRYKLGSNDGHDYYLLFLDNWEEFRQHMDGRVEWQEEEKKAELAHQALYK